MVDVCVVQRAAYMESCSNLEVVHSSNRLFLQLESQATQETVRQERLCCCEIPGIYGDRIEVVAIPLRFVVVQKSTRSVCLYVRSRPLRRCGTGIISKRKKMSIRRSGCTSSSKSGDLNPFLARGPADDMDARQKHVRDTSEVV